MGGSWLERFERSGWMGRAKLVSGTAVRLTAHALDHALERAARTVVDAERAFRRELDPNMEDAKILDEWEEPDARSGSSRR